jgi:thiol-disulfide isomerase/thioredoxin
MGKADRNRSQSARARIAAQQAQQRQAERRRQLVIMGSAGVVLLAVIGIIIGVALTRSTPKQAAATTGPLPASVQADLNVPASTLAGIGAGSVYPGAIRTATGSPPLTSAGKPEMLYIGAEWCPYCAAERWAMAVALKRFGTFSPLRGIHSSSTDVYPNTATLTFYQAKYTSSYLVFTPVENEDINHALLQKPTSAQQALWNKYGSHSYPFINFGNRYIAGTTYDPQVLHGLTWSQIASDLHNPSSPVAQGVNGSANIFTAAICKLTGNAPANVCTAAPVTALEGKI